MSANEGLFEDAPEGTEGEGEASPEQLEPEIPSEEPSEAEVIPLEDPRIVQLEGQVGELQARLRAVSAAYQKAGDEVALTRDRLQRQAAVQEELRRGEVVASLFEPVENLRRSLDALRKGASVEDTQMGLDLVLQQFMGAFKGLGLEELPGKGSKFDPNIHEALTLIPVPDAALDQAVVEVFAAGYRIGSRLIRPAKVIVGTWTPPVGEA
jgi:molecular chaperone GrpE